MRAGFGVSAICSGHGRCYAATQDGAEGVSGVHRGAEEVAMRAWVTGMVFAAVCAAPAAAHDDDRWGHRSYGGHRSGGYGIGYDNGYEEGLRHGRSDGRRGLSFDYAHDRDYRRGDDGYRSRYGSRHVYADAFRSGYRE